MLLNEDAQRYCDLCKLQSKKFTLRPDMQNDWRREGERVCKCVYEDAIFTKIGEKKKKNRDNITPLRFAYNTSNIGSRRTHVCTFAKIIIVNFAREHFIL